MFQPDFSQVEFPAGAKDHGFGLIASMAARLTIWPISLACSAKLEAAKAFTRAEQDKIDAAERS
jgi:hypothetical protein